MPGDLRPLLSLLRPHRAALGLAAGLALVVAALAAVSVGMLKPAVEVIFDPPRAEATLALARDRLPWAATVLESLRAAAAEDPVRALALLLAALVGITLVRGVLRWAHESIVGGVAQTASADLSAALFRSLLRQDVDHVQRSGAASFLSRFAADADAVAKGLETLGGSLVLEPLFFAAYATIAFAVSWKLALLAVVATPLLALLVRRVGVAVRRATRRVLERRQALVERVEETLRGVRVVQAYGAADAEAERFGAVNARLLAEFRRLVRLEAATGPALEVIALLGVCGALLAGGAMAARGALSPGDLVALGAALAGMYAPLRKIGGAFNRVQGALVAAGRVFDVLHRAPQVVDAPGARPLPRGPGALSFRGVSVTYPGGVRALRGVDLDVAPGTRVAVVGPSGSGKSTLVNLVPRFLDPSEGTVAVDGADLRGVLLASLRERLALVPQEVFLRDGTIRENVLVGRPSASEAEVLGACRAARVDEMLERLPGGLDAPVGPAGALLSGGERQRVAIARAMLRDPSILLLDEPTSSLDPRSEALVHEALERLCAGRTVLVVAHRLSTVRSADRVVLLEGGAVVAEGRHDDLLDGSELYRTLAAAGMPAGEGIPR